MEIILKALYGSFFYPSKSNIFNSLSIDLNNINLVIIGKHPYNSNQSTGIPYETFDGHNTSIINILNDIENSFYDGDFNVNRLECDYNRLGHWMDQGVCLLNKAFTSKKGNPEAHFKIWKWFTDEIIKIIAFKNPGCIFSYFGCTNTLISEVKHIVIEYPDPNTEQFKGVFKELYDIVKKNYNYEIIWDKYDYESKKQR